MLTKRSGQAEARKSPQFCCCASEWPLVSDLRTAARHGRRDSFESKTGYLEIKRYAIVPDVLGYSVKELLNFASSSDYVV
jgi:hypothetical protein